VDKPTTTICLLLKNLMLSVSESKLVHRSSIESTIGGTIPTHSGKKSLIILDKVGMMIRSLKWSMFFPFEKPRTELPCEGPVLRLPEEKTQQLKKFIWSMNHKGCAVSTPAYDVVHILTFDIFQQLMKTTRKHRC